MACLFYECTKVNTSSHTREEVQRQQRIFSLHLIAALASIWQYSCVLFYRYIIFCGYMIFFVVSCPQSIRQEPQSL